MLWWYAARAGFPAWAMSRGHVNRTVLWARVLLSAVRVWLLRVHVYTCMRAVVGRCVGRSPVSALSAGGGRSCSVCDGQTRTEDDAVLCYPLLEYSNVRAQCAWWFGLVAALVRTSGFSIDRWSLTINIARAAVSLAKSLGFVLTWKVAIWTYKSAIFENHDNVTLTLFFFCRR